MNRRNFVTAATAGAGLLLLPTWAIAAIGEPWVKVERIRIGLERRTYKVAKSGVDIQPDGREVPWQVLEVDALPVGPLPPDDENNYWAEAITVGDQCFYRAKGMTITATACELSAAIGNPYLYYFSTALRLHMRIKWAKTGGTSDIQQRT